MQYSIFTSNHVIDIFAEENVFIVWHQIFSKQDRRWNAEKPSATLDP